MKIAIASDHGGYTLKEHLKTYLAGKGHEISDCGTYSLERCDYPDFGSACARMVASGQCDRGIVLCTTGIGMTIAANKVKGVRCALCHDPLAAEMTRRDNDANMLALGGGITGPKLAERIADVFLSTEFESGGRHQRRVNKVMALEED